MSPSDESKIRALLNGFAAREQELRRLVAGERGALVQDGCADAPREPGDIADLAFERASTMQADRMIDRYLREIASIVAARERLRCGTFGECIGCGEPIDERRLSVEATAVRCADCQNRFERKSTLRH